MATMTSQPEARELSAQERKEREEYCYTLETRIKIDIATTGKALWDLGEAMYLFNEERGWSALGYETQNLWLAQPEIGMTKSDYMRIVRRHRELVINRKISVDRLLEIPPSKLDICMAAIETDLKPIEEILSDAETLGTSDLREEYMGPRAKEAREAKHAAETARLQADPPKDEDEIIESTATIVDPEVAKRDEELKHFAGVVDSWFELGGDRRKAERNWKKLLELHPIFQAVDTVSRTVTGGEEAPGREDTRDAWLLLAKELGLQIEV